MAMRDGAVGLGEGRGVSEGKLGMDVSHAAAPGLRLRTRWAFL